MGETGTAAVVDESTTQILTIIRDDVKEMRRDVKVQGQQIASISRTQEIQQDNLTTLRLKVDEVMSAHLDCPTPREIGDLKKRLSDVAELAKKPSRYTPRDGFKIQVETGGVWKKLLPYIILALLGGTGWAVSFFDILGKGQ